ncbi:MAG TPA: hypothetical protein VF173_21095 [Thermoanaerobaculia bacterium]|nr:hypothetical protein [Thermoanaerobaculia bacterium]
MVTPDEALKVVFEIARVLDELKVPYAVGGSLASSLWGIPRSTQDADLVADLRSQNVQSFVSGVEGAFYVSPERIHHAIGRRSSFNLIHLKTGLKVDVFLFKGDIQSLQEMSRRRIFPLASGDRLPVASPEDIVLQKLRWYRLGSGTSDQQWNDILGVLKVQRGSLDLTYLKEWAERIEVEDLLEKALQDSGIAPAAG